jgi:hypothetical protein
MEMGKKVYSTAENENSKSSSSNGTSDDSVIDADFSETK